MQAISTEAKYVVVFAKKGSTFVCVSYALKFGVAWWRLLMLTMIFPGETALPLRCFQAVRWP